MDLKKIFSTRRTRLGSLSGAGVAALAAGLVLVNLLSQRFFVRLDGTAGGRYSLSDASKALVRRLPDPVLARVYVSGGLPPPYSTSARYLTDLLGEYRAAARGKFKVEVYDPEVSEKAKEDARQAGVPPARFTQVASDQFQVREGFLGAVLFYQDKQEVIPFVKDPSGLELEITSRLRRMSRRSRKVLGLTAGHGETSLEDFRQGAGARLFEDFDVRPVALSTSAARPDALFVLNPAQAFSPADVGVLDAWISSGTPAAFFLSRKTVNMYSFRTFPRATGLEDLLAHYGVRLGEEIVLDAQCQQVMVQSQQGGMTVPLPVSYPAFIQSRPDGKSPLTRALDVLTFPFAHPLTAAPVAGIAFTPLAASSSYSWMPRNLESLSPYEMQPPAAEDPRGPVTLAALVEGSTTSFRDPARAANVKLAVVGTGAFVDGNLPLGPANAEFLSRVAGAFSGDADFISIPARGPAFRPLRRVPAPVRAAAKALGFFFLPGFTVVGGFWRWRRRRARRSAIQKEWEAAARA